MAISELEVVNACLATVGEMPLLELQDDHPLVAAARSNLQESLIAEMHLKWWFNTDYITLQRTEAGFIYAPADTIEINVHQHPELILRGRRLYDRSRSTYELTQAAVDCTLIRDLPFDDLPVSAQLLVQHATVLRFQVNYDADQQKTAQLRSLYERQYAIINAEHARQVRYNALEVPETLAARVRAGVRGRRWGVPVR